MASVNVSLDRALAGSAWYSMALPLRGARLGRAPSMARLPMIPEEVAAAYGAAEAAEAAVLAGDAGERDLPRPDTLPEPSARRGAELAPFVDLCASL